MIRVVLLFLSTSAFVTAIAKPRPEISILANIEVPADQVIQLKHLGTVNHASSLAMSNALQLEVLPSLKDGEVQKISSSDFVKMLKTKVSESVELYQQRWAYFVPELIEVKGVKNLISPLAIKNDLLSAYYALCEQCQLSIRDLRLPQIGEKKFKHWSLDTSNLMLSGSFLVPLNIKTETEYQKNWVSGVLKIKKPGVLAAKQIQAGERIVASSLKKAWIDVSFAKDSPAHPDAAIGLQAARSIAVNQPLFTADLRKEVAVQRGQVIKAILGSDFFEVSSQVLAEDSGFVGDTVKIRNMESKKVLTAVILEKGVVKIQ